jgi:hypothetical protein
MQHIKLAEHFGHYILLNNTSILAQKFWHKDHLTWKARERVATHSHEHRWQISPSTMWKLIIHFLKERFSERTGWISLLR